MTKTLLFSAILAALSIQCSAQKNTLSQNDYKNWNTIKSPKISNAGTYTTYKIAPLKNDPTIIIHNNENGKDIRIKNGASVNLNFSESFAFITIKPNQDTIRKLKKAKIKKDKFPHDTLRIIDLKTKLTTDLTHIKSYYCPDKGGEWISVHFKEISTSADTTEVDTTQAEKNTEKKEGKKKNKKKDKDIPETTQFIAFNPNTGDSIKIKEVSDYVMDRYGENIVVCGSTGDSITSSFIIHINTNESITDTIFQNEGIIKGLQIGDYGNYCSFFSTGDTSKNKVYATHIVSLSDPQNIFSIDSTTSGMKRSWATNAEHTPFFTEDETKLYFYTAPIPKPEEEDTLLDEEKCSVDIWNWKDSLLQPQQLKNKKKELNRGYLAVCDIKTRSFMQLADSSLPNVRARKRQAGNYLLATSSLPYQHQTSWGGWFNDVYIINALSGEKEKILEQHSGHASLSPGEQYLLFWNKGDSCWYSYDVKTKETVNLTGGLNINFYNEIHDMPSLPSPYRVAGWIDNDKGVIVSDYYDLWLLDPAGKNGPVNMTNGYGRDNKIRFSVVNLLKEQNYLKTDAESMLLKAFNEVTKGSGYYIYNDNNDPELLIEDDVSFGTAQKAKYDNTIIWSKETFKQFPDYYVSNINFNKIKRISDVNPQQSTYLWGDVQKVSWISAKGENLDGLLYTPENLDVSKKYPMLIYFYERSADNLHRHRIPAPSRSIINPSYCSSNGYVVFVPDITYGTGHPGKDCYDAVVSGTLAMCERFEFIDKERMGLQGQSWGGYQIAHLITQTDMYRCAMAGAPVSNMTSAYGGIRWSSGMSRAFQYEKTQSRIGETLWDAPELYIENSPVFFADQVNTPLLIMHNDEDGAVPWYQSIEYFSALRRLQKPVWMLVYNGAPHNLSRWPDRMDLDKRMMQFFDHYLKDQPAPIWMTKGVPAVKKGIEKGFEIEDQQ